MTDESIFAAALAIGSPSERAKYLDRACAGNVALRKEVEGLLAAHAKSNALDLEKGVFTKNNPKDIAASLKRSAETSTRKKADSFRSALSMLTLYINRAGSNLSQMRRRILTRAKDELRKQFGRG